MRSVSILSTASNELIAERGGFTGPPGIAVVGRTRTLYVLNVAPSGDDGNHRRAVEGPPLT